MTTPANSGPLRIVLFGLPRAGKTGLLAALAQIQDAQSSLLPGPLQDATGNLARQRQLFYDELPRSTTEETVPYPVHFAIPKQPLDAEFIDCDGRVVLELLKNPGRLSDHPGPLAQAILEADALILPLDASLKADQRDRVLAAINEFLHHYEQERGKRSDVVGLPVYLVLTKVDLLAEQGDSLSDWMGRIEEQKRHVRKQLHGLLSEADGERPTSFGRLAVHLWAASMRRPALRGVEARPRDPSGVAELFRQCLTEATNYRQRLHKADQRLSTTVRLLSSVAGVLALIGALFFSGIGQHRLSDLELRLELYRAKQGTSVAERLNDWLGGLRLRHEELKAILSDPEFAKLPEELRQEAAGWDQELKEYIPYLEKVLQAQQRGNVWTEAELRKVEKRLAEGLKLPEGKEEAWAETGANKIRQQRLEDLHVLRDQAARAVVWYQDRYREGLELLRFPQTGWYAWHKDLGEFLKLTAKLPDDMALIPAHSLITPTTVLNFQTVRGARAAVLGPDQGWPGKPGVVQKLAAVRDIGTALGRIEGVSGRPALLDLPERLSRAVVVERWRQLESHAELSTSLAGLLSNPAGWAPLQAVATFAPGHPFVPPYPDFDAVFAWDNIPESIRTQVVQDATRGYERLLEAMQPLVKAEYRQLPGGDEESTPRWQKLADWLKSDPAELRPYRRLARTFDRLRRAEGMDPVTELATFLTRSPTPTVIGSATLLVPDRLRVRVPSNAKLVLKVGDVKREFEQAGKERKTDTDDFVYSFRGLPEPVTLPRDEVVELSLEMRNDREQPVMLIWSGSRTRTFGWESLFQPPALHLVDRDGKPVPEGRRADKVFLKLSASPAIPPIPDLLPQLR